MTPATLDACHIWQLALQQTSADEVLHQTVSKYWQQLTLAELL